MHRARASWLLAIALLLLAPATSFAEPERFFGVNAGALIPYNSDSQYGGALRLEVLRRKQSDARLRTGMTLGVGGFDLFTTGLFRFPPRCLPGGAMGGDCRGYLISSRIGVLAHWMVIPTGMIQPYVGGGAELFINITDRKAPQPFPDGKNRTNGGIGLSAILGTDIVLSDNWKIFVEGRAAGDFAFGSDGMRIRDISGFTAATGFRVRF